MALLEVLSIAGFAGFAVAALLALKSHFAIKGATNVWLLFAIGFALLAVSRLYALSVYLDGSNGFVWELVADLKMAAMAVIFSALAVYRKEKRACVYCVTRKADAKTVKDIKKFADGV